MQGDADKISDEELYQRGLPKKYAGTCVENDFNTSAEVIFTEPRKMKNLIRQYPVIQRKHQVFKDFYLNIDKDFTPVFEKIDG
ncbi:MAG: hypothetical protein ACJAUP_001654 [Cellvibrionaceae bacterium]|jgi:hypothetical protein